MSVDMDGSAERLVLSYTQLQDLVDKLQKENGILKTRLTSYTTIGTFYHEARQELGRLSRQVALKDGLTKELQARLAAYEGSAARLGQDVAVSFGPSGSLVDSLFQEIGKVKTELADSARNWQQENDQLKEELQKVQQRLREKEREVEQMMSRPHHEKDAEIARLRRALGEKERLHATREVWCRSLVDETDQLQLRLAGTANMCQQLARQLEEQRAKCGQGAAGKEPDPMERDVKLRQVDSPEPNTCRLEEENRALKQKVIYVEELNTKWQKYDISREEYVKRLHHELKGLRSGVDQPAGFPPPQADADILHQEILRLNRLLQEKIQDCGRLAGYRDGLEKERATAQQLRKELESARAAGGAARERMQMLEQQVLVYKDDFKSERQDRERAQSRIQELEEDLARLKLQLPRKQHRDPTAHRHGNMSAYHLESCPAEPLLGNSSTEQPAVSGRAGNSPEISRPHSRSSGAEARQQGFLQCPKCLRLFNDEVSDECLRHISECCQ
ncbi:TNFAIP3-interacting protein 2 isoform X2 [Heptranchias perlo]|uniref:TNFAIP3-interacting protein 2 isoform X2 n=1 Tax=Heptranchias perlo TaxID=212740 RepID=UPI00355A8E12